MAWLPTPQGRLPLPSPAMRLAFPGPAVLTGCSPAAKASAELLRAGRRGCQRCRAGEPVLWHGETPAPIPPGRGSLQGPSCPPCTRVTMSSKGAAAAHPPCPTRCGSAGTLLQPRQFLCPPPCLAPRLSRRTCSSHPWSEPPQQPRAARCRAAGAASPFSMRGSWHGASLAYRDQSTRRFPTDT